MICKLHTFNRFKPSTQGLNIVLFKFFYPSKLAEAEAPLQTILLTFTCCECGPQEVFQFLPEGCLRKPFCLLHTYWEYATNGYFPVTRLQQLKLFASDLSSWTKGDSLAIIDSTKHREVLNAGISRGGGGGGGKTTFIWSFRTKVVLDITGSSPPLFGIYNYYLTSALGGPLPELLEQFWGTISNYSLVICNLFARC